MIPERKKVLFLVPSLAAGGAERVFALLLQYLDRTRFEPHLGILQAETHYLQPVPSDVFVHELRASRIRYALPAIVKLIRRLRPRTVISTLRNMNVLLMLSKPFLPRRTRLLVRESAIPTITMQRETNSPRLWTWLCRNLYSRADRVIAISDAMADDLTKGVKVSAAKIVRIYNPIDLTSIRELADIGESPYIGQGPHLVAAGRFSREKGFDVLLNAFPMVRRRFPGADMLILGEGPLRNELAAQAQQNGVLQHVQFPGVVSNPWRYFRHADVFVLPSRYDALPNVLLEALAVGTSVVATDCPGGVREIHACAAEISLVPPEDPEALAEAVICVLDQLRDGKAEYGHTPSDLSRFDLYRSVEEYSRLL